METLILGTIAVAASIGWGVDLLRSIKCMQKVREIQLANKKLIYDLQREKERVYDEAATLRVRLCRETETLNSERELTRKLKEIVKALEAENSKLTQDLVEAKNKLKTAHNNLRIMMVEYNRWKKGKK
jgi:predicted nuclease with TOPRIM domain